jgi:hypothetical protein
MDRCLLVTRIDDAEILVRHHIERRQNMIACQTENVAYAFELERFAN